MSHPYTIDSAAHTYTDGYKMALASADNHIPTSKRHHIKPVS